MKIAYPRKSYAPLIQINGMVPIGVEEGLYWVLQKEGWLYEGDSEYPKFCDYSDPAWRPPVTLIFTAIDMRCPVP